MGATLAAFASDFHVPYHDEGAFDAFVEMLSDVRPSFVGLVGDFGEWLAFSQHDPDSAHVEQARSEAEAQREALGQIRGAVGDKARIVLLRGNHETRPRRWCLRYAPKLLSSFEIPHVLNLREHGIEWHEKKIRLGSVTLIHGDGPLGRGSAANHARKMAHLYGHVVYGHTHKPQTAVDETEDGGKRRAIGLGCIAQLRPGFTGGSDTPNGWAHGVALGDVPARGDPWIVEVPIFRGVASLPGVGRWGSTR